MKRTRIALCAAVAVASVNNTHVRAQTDHGSGSAYEACMKDAANITDERLKRKTIGICNEQKGGIGEPRANVRPATATAPSSGTGRNAVPSSKGYRARNESGSGSGGAYNGAWVGASFGECIVSGWRWNAQISGGIISGANVNGRVSQGGGVRGAMNVFGTTYDFRGQLRSNQGSGTWVVRSGTKTGCTGTWTISKS